MWSIDAAPDLDALSNRGLREYITAAGFSLEGCVTKAELRVRALEAQAAAPAPEPEEDDGEDWAACWEEPLSKDFCLHAQLGLQPNAKGDVASRVRAAFHAVSRFAYPREWEADLPTYEAAVLRFRRICLSFVVLVDPERRRIYETAGYAGLRSSEAYQEESVFDRDATDVFEAFFEGRSEADREYLLLNGDARPAYVGNLPDAAGAADSVDAGAGAGEADAVGEGDRDAGGGDDDDDDDDDDDGDDDDDDDDEMEAAAAAAAASAEGGDSDSKRRVVRDVAPPMPPMIAGSSLAGCDWGERPPEGPWAQVARRLAAESAAPAAVQPPRRPSAGDDDVVAGFAALTRLSGPEPGPLSDALTSLARLEKGGLGPLDSDGPLSNALAALSRLERPRAGQPRRPRRGRLLSVSSRLRLFSAAHHFFGKPSRARANKRAASKRAAVLASTVAATVAASDAVS